MKSLLPGFTLLEILIVIGLLASVSAFSAYESIGSFERALEHTATEQRADASEAARGEAIRGIHRDAP